MANLQIGEATLLETHEDYRSAITLEAISKICAHENDQAPKVDEAEV